MNYFTMTMSRQIFFRLLAYAPEELQREAKENARRTIPALCFTEDDIRERFAQEDQWKALSDDEQREAISALLDAEEYKEAGAAGNQTIAKAVTHYLKNALLSKGETPSKNEFTW